MSEALEMNKEDMKKVGKGLMIALAGAALTYLEETIPSVTFGEWTIIVTALNSVIVNFGRKLLFQQY